MVPEKAERVKEIKSLIQKYRAIGIASLNKVRAPQLQELRKKLEETAYLRVIKNALMEKAIGECQGKPNIEKLREHLKGSNLFLFTNLNPFKLAFLLERSKVKDHAKVGDIATEDIIVAAGNTGLPPGPIISQLGSVGILTRIEAGSVWINRDTVVARKGEVISESLAPILSKLGIKPIEMGLSPKVVYDDGFFILGEELGLRLEEYEKDLGEAYAQALNLSLNAAYPMAENISVLIKMTILESYNLAFNASILSPEVMPDLIRKAYAEAVILQSRMQVQMKESTG